MIRLLGAEFNRLLSRRALWISLAAGVFLMAVMLTSTASAAAPPSADQLSQGESYYQQAHAEWVAHSEQILQACRDSAPPDQVAQCAAEPKREDFVATAMSYSDALGIYVGGAASVAALLTLIVGSTFVGAEYSSGFLATWLAFVPRRGRVFAAKTVAVAVASALLAALLAGLAVAGATAVVGALQGTHALVGGDEAFWKAVRGVAVAVLAGVLGCSLAFLFRNTIAVVAGSLGYLIVASFLSGFQATEWFAPAVPWLPEVNLTAFLDKGYTYLTFVQVADANGLNQTAVERTVSFEHGAAYLAAMLFAAVSVSLILFLRRDVKE